MTPLDPEKARAMARTRWAKPRPGDPFAGSFLDFMDVAGLTGASWAAWRAHWKAVDGLPLDAAELEVFRRHTGRQTPPAIPVREVWDVCGRRSGKTRGASARAFYEAIRRDYRQLLAPGERAVIPVIAADRKQAGQAFGYIARGLARLPEFAPYVARTLKESIELTTGVTIEVHTANYRTTRGYTVVALVADEVSFWMNLETGANPDTEILAALRPGMATVPGALLIGVSTPYARRGELYRAHERYFAKDDARTLVWVGDTASMNPTLDPAVIAEAFATDPIAAASEYGQGGTVVFRSDVETFLDPEVVAAATVAGRFELPPAGHAYLAFCDPSGGSQDSFTLAIAHAEGERGVLDVVRERRPPFSPDHVCREFAAVLQGYGILTVTGDHYSAEWVREGFARHGVEYRPAERTRSEVYAEFVAPMNAKRIELLDVPLLRAQLVGLERRTARGGRDSIDHAPGGHDDVANAVAGALVLAVGGGAPWERWIALAQEGVLSGPLASAPPRPTAAAPADGARAAGDTALAPASRTIVRDGTARDSAPPAACPACGSARWSGESPNVTDTTVWWRCGACGHQGRYAIARPAPAPCGAHLPTLLPTRQEPPAARLLGCGRCGAMMDFTPRADGSRTRCPSCGAEP